MAVVAIIIIAIANAAMILLRAENLFAAWFVGAVCFLALERLATFFLATCDASPGLAV